MAIATTTLWTTKSKTEIRSRIFNLMDRNIYGAPHDLTRWFQRARVRSPAVKHLSVMTIPAFYPARLLLAPAQARGLAAVGAWWRVRETRAGVCFE